MTDTDLTPYVEVQQVRMGQVNEYLQHGYVLLGFVNFAQSATHGDVKPGTPSHPSMFYTRRGLAYIVGRTAQTASWAPTAKPRKPAAKAPTADSPDPAPHPPSQ